MKKRYDIIIIGAGHNGLTAAAYLAQAGRSVLVLERREVLGGAAATEEVWPNFHVNTGAEDAGMFQEAIIKELFLQMNGLETRQSEVAIFAPQRDAPALTLYRDVERSAAEIAQISERDAAAYPEFVAQVNRFTAVLQNMLLNTPPDIKALGAGELMSWGGVGLKLRRLGGDQMMEFMRILPMPAREYLDEWFESDVLKGALGVDAVTGTMQGPRSAGTTLQFLYQHINGFLNGRSVIGGIGALSQALAEVAKQAGAEIRLGTGVKRLQIENGRIVTVLLENGDQIPASVVLSSATPQRTFMEFVGPQQLEPRFVRATRNIIYRGSTAKLLLALDSAPEFWGQVRAEQLVGRIRVAQSLDAIEKAYDCAKYGRYSTEPILDITIPTLLDGSLAPSGQHVMSVVVRYVPSGLADEERDEVETAVFNVLEQAAPNLQNQILHKKLLMPQDYEQEYGLTEGSIFQGQMGLDQLLVMRPVAGWGQYKTPIENLYLCGAGAHPGGGVTGAPGYNAAQVVLAAK